MGLDIEVDGGENEIHMLAYNCREGIRFTCNVGLPALWVIVCMIFGTD